MVGVEVERKLAFTLPEVDAEVASRLCILILIIQNEYSTLNALKF